MWSITSGDDLRFSGMLSTVGAEVRNLMELKVGANSLSATFRDDRLVRKV